MVFFLRALAFALTALIMTLSAVVLAFTLSANMVPVSFILILCALYTLILSFLAAYPLFQLFALIAQISADQKEIYGGSFARLRK